jgi:hypothetical protein
LVVARHRSGKLGIGSFLPVAGAVFFPEFEQDITGFGPLLRGEFGYFPNPLRIQRERAVVLPGVGEHH